MGFFSGGSVFFRSPPHTYTLYTGPVGAYRLAAGKTTEQRARIWAGFGSVHTGGRISSSHTRCSEREWPAKTPGACSVVRARLVRGPWRAHGSRHGGWVLNKAAETYSGPHLSRVVTHRMYSSVRDPRKPRGGIPWRAHGSRHGGWVLKEAAETIPPPTLKGSHTPTPPVPLWRLHQSLHWSGRESRTDTACCTHTPGALSRRPSPHVEGRRVGARTHGVQHRLHAHRAHGAGGPGHPHMACTAPCMDIVHRNGSKVQRSYAAGRQSIHQARAIMHGTYRTNAC